MISTLPDINAFSAGPPALENNVVMLSNTTHKYFYPEHKTPYLFVANFLNRGEYVLNKKHIETSDRWFYFLNANDELEINFSAVPLQTLFILYTDTFIRECYSSFITPHTKLIDTPGFISNNELFFPAVPFAFTQTINEKTTALRQKGLQKEDIDYLLFEILYAFYDLVADTKKKMQRLDAVKRSTKEELYRRLFSATVLMNDLVFENLTNEQIAQQVCLNKFHFLSCFKALYQCTPHQYFRELKLQKAYQLLRSNQYSVTQVCHLLAFESVGSFSNLFKKRFGVTPGTLAAA